MSADAAETPVNPKIPATIDTRKKTSAHFNSVIGSYASTSCLVVGLTSRDLGRSMQPTDFSLLSPGTEGCDSAWSRLAASFARYHTAISDGSRTLALACMALPGNIRRLKLPGRR